MTGKKWYSVLEEFFYDDHKRNDEASLEIGGEFYEYVIPDFSDNSWIQFCCRMLMSDDCDIMSPYDVCKIAAEYGIEIPEEILEYLEH